MDTETTTNPLKDPAVYLFGFSGDGVNLQSARNLESGLNALFDAAESGDIVYAQNLKFEWSFIFPFISDHPDEWEIEKETISGVYSKIFEIVLKRKGNFAGGTFAKTLRFREANILFNPNFATLADILEGWTDGYQKGHAEYYRDVPDEISPEFMEYFRIDVLGLWEAVSKRLGFSYHRCRSPKLTASSDAYAFLTGKAGWRKTFPPLSLEDNDRFRKYYAGGFCFSNPAFRNRVVDNVWVYDVNSLYPWIMRDLPLPCGNPIDVPDPTISDLYRARGLFLARFKVTYATLREGRLPWLNIGGITARGARQYESDVVDQWININGIEWEEFKQDYDFEIECVEELLIFKEDRDHHIAPYIDAHIKLKEESTGATRIFAKLMLNGVSGKFAQNPRIKGKQSILKDGRLAFADKPEEEPPHETKYIPLSIFITAHGRAGLYRKIREIGIHSVAYGDTDSLHTIGPVPDLPTHPTKLGYWDVEQSGIRAKYLERKRYLLQKADGSFVLKATGIKKAYWDASKWGFEEFRLGARLSCEKMKVVVGGSVMLPVEVAI